MNTRDIKRRIRQVDNTRQITRAMEMVAATKMRRAQEAVKVSRDYATKARELLGAVTADASAADVLNQPLLAKRPVKRSCLVVMTSDRGLCGAMNANVLRYAQAEADKEKAAISYVAVGGKAERALARADQTLVASFAGLADSAHYEDIRPVAKILVDEFTAGRLDRITLVYPQFVSTLVNRPHAEPLLPAEPTENSESQTTAKGPKAVTLYEPSAESVLDSLVPRVLEVQLFQALLETKASEHSARMMAMRNATNNASDLLDELRFSFNQARQQAITTEIAEISAAAIS